MDILSYIKAKRYTDETVIGGGALSGKNCVVESIINHNGYHVVTFKWTLDDGTVERESMRVEDGITPEITIKENTNTRYVLHIKSGDTEFDTPNLRGGGGSATSDYNALDNRPKINGVTLEGDKSNKELKLDKFNATYDKRNERVTISI